MISRLLICALASITLAGCGKSAPWASPDRYEIQDCENLEGSRLAECFAANSTVFVELRADTEPLADPQALDSVGKGSNRPSIDDMNLTDPDERRATSIVLLIDQFNEHYEDWSRGDCRDEQGISIFSQCAVHTLSLRMSSSMIDKTLNDPQAIEEMAEGMASAFAEPSTTKRAPASLSPLPETVQSKSTLDAYLTRMYDQLQVCAGIEGILAAGCTEETLKPALTTMMQLALGLDKFPVTRGEAGRQWEDAAQFSRECSELDNNVKGAMANCISLAIFPDAVVGEIRAAFEGET